MSPFRVAELALILALSTLTLSLAYSSYMLLASLANLTSIKLDIHSEYIVLEGFKLENNGLYDISILLSIDLLYGDIRLARYTGNVRLKPTEILENLTLKLEDKIYIPPSIVDGSIKAAATAKIFIEPLVSIKLEVNRTLERLPI